MNNQIQILLKQLHTQYPKLQFDIISDTHVNFALPDKNLYSCLDDIRARKVRHVLIGGDVTSNGYAFQYTSFFHMLKEFPFHYAIALGNHDTYNMFTKHAIKMHPLYTELCLKEEHSLYYRKQFHGYSFYVLNTQTPMKRMAHFHDDQLSWLSNALQREDSTKPVFVLCHQPLTNTHPHSEDTLYSLGPQSGKLMNILNQHPHVIFLSGHIHNSYSLQSIFIKDTLTLIDIPSLKTIDYGLKQAGIGYHIQIYKDFIYIQTRDYLAHTWITNNTFLIDFKNYMIYPIHKT